MRRLSARSRRSRRISPSLSPPVLWQVITSEYLHVKPLIGRWLHAAVKPRVQASIDHGPSGSHDSMAVVVRQGFDVMS